MQLSRLSVLGRHFSSSACSAQAAPSLDVASLHNRYWALRHGFSLANEAGVVVSLPSNGRLKEFGLARKGHAQAEDAGFKIASTIAFESVVIMASDFRRTHETALHVQEAVVLTATKKVSQWYDRWDDPAKAEPTDAAEKEARLCCPIYLQPDLRERQFGQFELEKSAGDCYEQVWAEDSAEDGSGLNHTSFGVESVNSVARRVSSLVGMAERHFEDKDVFLVSHGDTLQITQTLFAGISPIKHRSLPHLETCELRKLN